MSGLQASISTHIAREYFFGGVLDDSNSPKNWGINVPLFIRAVGSHPDRINNLYFAFLFVLRAVAKAENYLSVYPYHTDDPAEDAALAKMMRALVSGKQLTAQVQTYLS